MITNRENRRWSVLTDCHLKSPDQHTDSIQYRFFYNYGIKYFPRWILKSLLQSTPVSPLYQSKRKTTVFISVS